MSDQHLLVLQNRVNIELEKNNLPVKKAQARIKLRKNPLHSGL